MSTSLRPLQGELKNAEEHYERLSTIWHEDGGLDYQPSRRDFALLMLYIAVLKNDIKELEERDVEGR